MGPVFALDDPPLSHFVLNDAAQSLVHAGRNTQGRSGSRVLQPRRLVRAEKETEMVTLCVRSET